MADDTNDGLGKPVSGFKTKIAHTVSGTGLLIAAATVAVGATMLILGHRTPKPIMNIFERNPGIAQVADHLAIERGMSDAAITRTLGAATLATGAIVGEVSKSGWDSASSAARTRNYIKAKQELDSQAQGQGAGRGA